MYEGLRQQSAQALTDIGLTAMRLAGFPSANLNMSVNWYWITHSHTFLPINPVT